MTELSAHDLARLARWRLATSLSLILGYMGYYLVRQNLPAAFPLMQVQFHYSNAELGLIAAVSELVYALGKFLNGPVTDRLGGRRVFLIGMAGGVLCNLAFAYGSSILWFTAVWCLCRYFLSMGWGAVAKSVGVWFAPERNGVVMGWFSLSYQFGGLVATLFAAWLVSRGASWQQLFLWPAGVVALLGVLAFFGIKERPDDVVPGASKALHTDGPKPLADFEAHDKVGTRTIVRTLLSLSLFRQMLLFAFLITFMRSIFVFWTPKFLVDIGMDATGAIFSSALLPFLGCLGTLLLGWYTDRYARRNRAAILGLMLLGLTVCLAAISLLAPQGAAHHLAIVLLLGMSGFFLLGPESMVLGAMMLDVTGPRAAGTGSGIMDGVAYLGGALATWGAGALSDSLGWSEVFRVLAFSAMLSLFSAVWMSRHFKRTAMDDSAQSA